MQGATEVMLALGLQDKMVGTAYLDDDIWPEFKAEYAKIPVIGSKYPNVTTLMNLKPDFIYGSYASAFGVGATLNYSAYYGKACSKSVTTTTTKFYCRKEIQDNGTNTYLQIEGCEDVNLRPAKPSEDYVKSEIWDIANIFGAQAKAMKLIQTIDGHFKSALKVVSDSTVAGAPKMKVLWLDGWSLTKPFIGACCGAPNLIIDRAGGVNALPELGKALNKPWDSGNWDDIANADPDVIVLIDASWDQADLKIFHLCNNTKQRNLRAVQTRRFITVPFSGSTLGVKNGAVAYNLAEAMVALVRGKNLNPEEFSVMTITADGDAGKQAASASGTRTYLNLPIVEIEGKKVNLDEFCPGKNTLVVKAEPTITADVAKMLVQVKVLSDGAVAGLVILGVALVLLAAFVIHMIRREKNGEPVFQSLAEPTSDQGKQEYKVVNLVDVTEQTILVKSAGN
jgi:iron complex transport system substrate-binding protein